jgi:membrane-associated protease RseP (regulator of RpoE activity)
MFSLKANFLPKAFFTFLIGGGFNQRKFNFHNISKNLNFLEKYNKTFSLPLIDPMITYTSPFLHIGDQGSENTVQHQEKEAKIDTLVKKNPLEKFTFILQNLHMSFNSLLYFYLLRGGKMFSQEKHEKDPQPYLGAQIVPDLKGLRIISIREKSPAEKSKLKVGDIIVLINNKAVNDQEKYIEAIGKKAGEKTLLIYRENCPNKYLEKVVKFSFKED